MKVEHYIDGCRFILSNENLQIGDKVFPLIGGRFVDGEMFFHSIDFPEDFSEPHTITSISKEYIYTSHGYSHPPRYFKIIKVEQQIKDDSGWFVKWYWEDVPLNIFLNGTRRKT